MGELAAFNNDEENERIVYWTSEGGLTEDECAALTEIAVRSIEVKEHELPEVWLKWGKYLADNLIISEFFDDEGHNIFPPSDSRA